MPKGFFITGTGTDCGKTVVTAYLVAKLRQAGINACVFKPVLSGTGHSPPKAAYADIEFVQKVSGLQGSPQEYSVYAFPDPVSPHLAAERSGARIELGSILKKYQDLTASFDVIIVEGCGGVAVPFNRTRFMQTDLIKALNLPVIISAQTGVGTLNHSVLTATYLREKGIVSMGFILSGNRGRFFEEDNIHVLPGLTDLPVLDVLPHFKGIDTVRLKTAGLKNYLLAFKQLPDYLKMDV